MEIGFENKVLGAYREVSHQVKRVQESAESVVPDTNDDIGRIASVQTSILLKSKDVTSRGVVINGEANSMLLYITESESSVSFVRVSKPFTMEYEIGEIDQSMLTHINLKVTNTEARVLNPRKVSVTIELAGELSCYLPESVNVETLLPEDVCEGLHARFETAEAVLANAVCEKTFAINEQYSFPAGKPLPTQLVSQCVDFCISDTQHIGSKIIIKGDVNLTVCYLSSDVNYPVRAQFSSAFSQIIDTGVENMDSCSAIIEMTSSYFELIDTINGEKAMDAELHAVIQLVSRCRQKINYISDAYSNAMPARCGVQNSQLSSFSDMLRSKLSIDERVTIAEDCADVLSVFSAISQITSEQDKFTVSVALDIIYRTRDGSLSVAKRMLSLTGECLLPPSRVIDSRLSNVYLRPDGGAMDARIELEISYLSCTNIELARVMAVSTEDEEQYDQAQFPTVTLVRAEKETLWELAKAYHSSIERICALNDVEDGICGKLLLIPKEL